MRYHLTQQVQKLIAERDALRIQWANALIVPLRVQRHMGFIDYEIQKLRALLTPATIEESVETLETRVTALESKSDAE